MDEDTVPKKISEVKCKKFKNSILFESGFMINEVGALIWSNIDDKNSFKSLVEVIYNEYTTDKKSAKIDLENFLIALKNEKMISF